MGVKLSVLTTVYNGAPFLAEAIDSILGQTFGDYEFLLIDDGSTDGSPEILRRYAKQDKRIRVMTLPHNRGTPYASNIGLKKARAPLIARMDADDISLPERLQKQYDYMGRHRDVGFLSTRWCGFTVDEGTDKKKIIFRPSFPKTAIEMRLQYLCGLSPGVHGACMFRSDLASNLGGYREFFRIGGEDWDLAQRLWDQSSVVILPEILLWCRWQSPTSKFAGNVPSCTAGGVMAMLCALYRQAGRGDPIAAVKSLTDLPAYLGLPPSVTLEALQRSPYWGMVSIIEHLQRRTLAPPVRARLYGRLASLYCRRRNFPNRRVDWRRYIFCVAASMIASISAFYLRVRSLWA